MFVLSPETIAYYLNNGKHQFYYENDGNFAMASLCWKLERF